MCHSIELNGVQSRIKAYNCDLRKINEVFGAEQFSLVTMNPPYKPVGTGIESLGESARIARHEVCCNIEDACKAASYLLKYAGRFCMCHRPERLVDTLELMRKYKIEPKRLRFVQDKTGEQPFLFLVQGQKGAKPFLRVEPQLIIKRIMANLHRKCLIFTVHMPTVMINERNIICCRYSYRQFK